MKATSLLAVLLATALAPAPSARQDEGVVGWWKLDELADGAVADSSGHGTVGKPQPGVELSSELCPANFRNARSMHFDGKSGCVAFGNDAYAAVSNSFTMAFWAKPTTGRMPTPECISGWPGTSGQRYAIFPRYGNPFQHMPGACAAGVSVGTNGISVFEHADAYMPSPLVYAAELKDWVHVAVVYADGRPTLCVNGSAVRVGAASPRIVHPGASIGGVPLAEKPFSEYGNYEGWLGDVRIYSRALSEREVLRLAAGAPNATWSGGSTPDAVRCGLADGSVLFGTIDPAGRVAFDTDFGRLQIPMSQFSSLSLSKLRPADVAAMDAKVDGLIARLGDDDPDARSRSEAELREIGGVALSRIRAAADKAHDAEILGACGRLVKAIESSKAAIEIPRDAAVLVDGSRLRGWVADPAIALKARFGEVSLKLADLKVVDWNRTFDAVGSSGRPFLVQFRSGWKIWGSWEGDGIGLRSGDEEKVIPLEKIDEIVIEGTKIRIVSGEQVTEGLVPDRVIVMKTRVGTLRFPMDAMDGAIADAPRK